jgi:AAA15 family ATPase/GTPase
MILEFGVKNYRSIKQEMVLSLIAESGKSKPNNLFEFKTLNGETIRLLKSIAIFGPNASGKSTLFRAMFFVLNLLKNNNAKAGKGVKFCEPFKFDKQTRDKPSEFWIVFIGPENTRYKYIIVLNSSEILKEEMFYYPNGRETIVFERIVPKEESILHIGRLGASFGKSEYELFNNHLFLAKFGEDVPHKFLSELYVHFEKYEVINALNTTKYLTIQKDLNKKILSESKFGERINALVKSADTQLLGIVVKNENNKEIDDDDENDDRFINTKALGIHNMFDGEKKIGEEVLPMFDESSGTLALFCIGGKILESIEKGGTIFIDELDTSLHPAVAKMMVELIQSSNINYSNSQMIFSTHDISLLDRNIFRKDQYWFTEKLRDGSTELYSLQDFESVREDTPFDKWYTSKKFGAYPEIGSLENNISFE